MSHLGPTERGKVALSVDFRSPTRPGEETRAYWSNLDNALVLFGLLAHLAGPDVEVFVEFGKVIVRDIDLAELAKRAKRFESTVPPSPVARTEDGFRSALERAVAELERRDRNSRKGFATLTVELRELLS